MKAPRLISTFASNDDVRANEVALCPLGDELWVGWSRSTLGAETVRLGTCRDGGIDERASLGSDGAPVFRPAVARVGESIALGACATGSSEARVLGRLCDAGGANQRGWCIAGDAVVLDMAMASHDSEAWLACEEWRGGNAVVGVYRLAPDGTTRRACEVAANGAWCRMPAIVSDGDDAWIAWAEGPVRQAARIRVARVGAGGVDRPIDLPVRHPGAHAAAPRLVRADRRLIVAWHETTDDTVLRWLRVAQIGLADREVTALDPPIERPSQRAEAGTDQGWELAGVVAFGSGACVAGRSSHGFHIASCDEHGAWSPRSAVSSPEVDWGGRGRRLAFTTWRQRHWLGRREPTGVEISEVAP